MDVTFSVKAEFLENVFIANILKQDFFEKREKFMCYGCDQKKRN